MSFGRALVKLLTTGGALCARRDHPWRQPFEPVWIASSTVEPEQNP